MKCSFCGKQTTAIQFESSAVGYYPQQGSNYQRLVLGDRAFELLTNPNNLSQCCDFPLKGE